MDWRTSYSSSFLLKTVNPATWRDEGDLQLTGGSISRTVGGASADITMTEDPGEQWVRLYLVARQSGDGGRVPLFTGLTSAPTEQINGTAKSYRVECHSVLKPAEDILLPRGYYAAEGANGALLAAELLRICPAPVTYADNAPDLTEAVIAEDGESNASMAKRIAEAIGWQIRIAGDGSIRISAPPAAESAKFDVFEGDAIEPALTHTYDWYSCPNCLRVVSGGSTAEARDDDPDSALSTVTRGREIWKQEKSVTLGDRETLAAYAQRRLKELQAPSRTVNYRRRYDPDVFPGDLVRLHYPGVGIQGLYRVGNQSVTIGKACTTQEDATYERN